MKQISFKTNMGINFVGITGTLVMLMATYFGICNALVGFIVVFIFVLFCNTRNFMKNDKSFDYVQTQILNYSQKEIDTIREDTSICFYANLAESFILLFSFALCDGVISAVLIIISLGLLFFECGSYYPYIKQDNWDKIDLEKKERQEMVVKFEKRKAELDSNIQILSNKYENDLGKADKVLLGRKENLLYCLTLVFQKQQRLVLATTSKVYNIPFSSITGCNLFDTSEDDRKLAQSLSTSMATTTQKTDNMDMAKRAIVGAAIGGVAGAAVGALTANKTSVTESSSTSFSDIGFIAPQYVVRITTTDFANLKIDLSFGEEIEMATDLSLVVKAIVNIPNKESANSCIKVEDISL